MKTVSRPHEATIKRHLEESLATGVPLDEIHSELGEIFSEKGRYTQQEIIEVTSWLRSSVLGQTTATLDDWDETDDAISQRENTNFDNPQKNECREWHMSNVVKHTNPRQRESMRFSILPGQNTYDFEAISKIGIPTRNLLTFILGNDPKAVAQYIRNCRLYGIKDRKVGTIADHLPSLEKPIDGLYWDFFSQICPAVVKDMWAVPLPENSSSIPVGVNLLKSRENSSIKNEMFETVVRKRRASTISLMNSDPVDLMNVYYGKLEDGFEENLEIGDIRDETAQPALFGRMGTSNTKNWVMESSAERLVNQVLELSNDERRYKDLDNAEKLIQFENCMTQVMYLCGHIAEQSGQDEHYFKFLPLLANSISLIMVNRPVIVSQEKPKEYQSGNHQPFVSYFGVVKTQRNLYLKYVDVIDFLFKFVHEFLPPLFLYTSGLVTGEQYMGESFIKGDGPKKEMCFMKHKKIIASIKLDRLLEANSDLATAICSESVRAKLRQNLKYISRLEKGKQNLFPAVQPLRKLESDVGRNAPCSCGSGKKFKKCCGRS